MSSGVSVSSAVSTTSEKSFDSVLLQKFQKGLEGRYLLRSRRRVLSDSRLLKYDTVFNTKLLAYNALGPQMLPEESLSE